MIWLFLFLGFCELTLEAEGLFGSKPWVTILVRFSDTPTITPHPRAWYEALMGTNYPGMDHYFREVSYGQMNLSGSIVVGWYTLPHPKSFYQLTNALNEVYLDKERILPDAVALADPNLVFST